MKLIKNVKNKKIKKKIDPYNVQTAARPVDIILHSDTEQIYFIGIIWIYTYTYIHIHIYTNTHTHIYTYT